MHLMEASRVYISGMAEWMAHLQHTSYVLVCLSSLILSTQANFLPWVLDPNYEDMYFQDEWDSEQYMLSMKQLKNVVCGSLITGFLTASWQLLLVWQILCWTRANYQNDGGEYPRYV